MTKYNWTKYMITDRIFGQVFHIANNRNNYQNLVSQYAAFLRNGSTSHISFLSGYSRNEKESLNLDLLLPEGKTSIIYKDVKFTLELVVYPSIKAINSFTTKHYELIISIDTPSRERAEELLKGFIEDAENFA